MKKSLALLLVFVLVFSLVSCTDGEKPNGGMSKNEMLKITQKAPIDEIISLKSENLAEAESTYLGTVYSFTGHVSKIFEDHIELIPYGYFDSITAYMSEKDIDSISENEIINIVGEISSIATDESQIAELSCSYYVDSDVKVSGWIRSIEEDADGGYTACIIDLPYKNNKNVLWRFKLDSAEKTGEDSSQNDVFRGKYDGKYLYKETFVTVKCNAEFTYFDDDFAAQSKENKSCVQINKVLNLSVN